jgi:hypothetical protein
LNLQRRCNQRATLTKYALAKDKRGVDLISDALPFGWLCYAGGHAVSNAIGYVEHYSRSHDAVIRVYDQAGNVIETHGTHCRFQEVGVGAVEISTVSTGLAELLEETLWIGL